MRCFYLVRAERVEPSSLAWKAGILPLYDARMSLYYNSGWVVWKDKNVSLNNALVLI